MIEANMYNVLPQDALAARLNGFRRGLDKFLKDGFMYGRLGTASRHGNSLLQEQ